MAPQPARPTTADPAARSEDEVFAPGGPVVHLTLGGIDKPIRQLPARANEAWKNQLAAEIASHFAAAGAIESIEQILALFAGTDKAQVSLLVAYDVDGRLGGADWILDHAVPSEIWTGFKEVLKAAFPFLVDVERAPETAALVISQLGALLGNKPSPPGA